MQLDVSIDIETHEDVYNPSDDSYLLLKVIEVSEGESFLDMGCGTGLIAIHAARHGNSTTAVDINPHAIELTKRNAAKNGVRVHVVSSDLFAKVDGYFDVIAFNPPYLPGDSTSTSWIERAWSGGSTGSEVSSRFLEEAWRHLAPGGRIYMVLSSLTGVTSVLKAARDRYKSVLLEEQRMLFESLFAYRFTMVQ